MPSRLGAASEACRQVYRSNTTPMHTNMSAAHEARRRRLRATGEVQQVKPNKLGARAACDHTMRDSRLMETHSVAHRGGDGRLKSERASAHTLSDMA